MTAQLSAQLPQAQFGTFADPYRLVADAFEALLPKPEITVPDWAAQPNGRFINNPGGGYTGFWSHDQLPYLVQPMDVLKGTTYLTAVVVGPGQCGKSTIAENWLGASIDTDPADFLWYMQTNDAVESFVKDRINQMILDHPERLQAKLGLNSVDNSLHYKRFAGMAAQFLAGTYSNLISKKAPRIVADEIDAWDKALGDVLETLDIRRETFGRDSTMLAMSHPDRATGLDPDKDWQSGIMAAYRDSDRRVWYWPCPECGLVSSPAPTAKFVTQLHWDPKIESLDELAAKTHLICPHNGCIIEDHQRRAMNIAALHSPWDGWIGAGQEIEPDGKIDGRLIESSRAGFWILGAMSNLLQSGGIGGLARAVVKAERDVETGADEEALQSRRTAYTKRLGIPPPPLKMAGTVDAEVLAERAETDFKLGTVPAWVRFLTVFVDIQKTYFDVMVRGWGRDGESGIVDQFKIAVSERRGPSGDFLPIDPAMEKADWDQMLTLLTAKRWPLAADPTRGMAARVVGYDTGGAPGVTAQAYAAWLRWHRPDTAHPDRRIQSYGDVGGRRTFSIMPMKGVQSPKATRLQVVWPDSQRKDRKVVTRGEMPLALFSTDLFKTEMAGHLGKAMPGEWYVHFPHDLRSKQAPHAFFEQLAAETPDKSGHWEPVKPGARNEAIDQMVGTHVLAHLLGLNRAKWERPLNWQAEQDKNSMVAPISSQAAATSSPMPAAATPNPTPRASRSLGAMLP